MAQLIKRAKKDGKTAYLARVYCGRDKDRKPICKTKTLTPPLGMTGRKLDKELQRQADEFEQAVLRGTLQSDMLFDALLDKYFSEYAEPQLRERTVYDYKKLAPRVRQALGCFKLSAIKPDHIMRFYKNLGESNIRQDSTYTATKNLLDLLPKGKRKAVTDKAGISERTMNTVCKGENVSRATAEKVSNAAGLAFSKAFAEHAKEGGKLNGNTLQHYHAFLSSVFSRAVVWQLIDSNPCDRVQPPKHETPDVQVLDENEIAQLLKALETAPPLYSTMTQLALFTGARREELCALRWADVDFERATIRFERSMQRIPGAGVVFAPPKTKRSRRIIRVGDNCIELLREYRQIQREQRLRMGSAWVRTVDICGKTIKNDLIFTRVDGAPFDPHSITSWFSKFLKANDLTSAHFHSLRHPYVKHTTKIFSLRLMDFQAQAYPDARRKTRGACQLLRVGQSRSPVRPLCNRKRFSCLPPQSKMSWILYAISMRLSGYTSTRSISSSASSVVSVSASKIALDASMRLSCRACSSCFCFACANTAA